MDLSLKGSCELRTWTDIQSIMVVRAVAGAARPASEEAPPGVSAAARFEFDDVYEGQVRFVWRVLRGMGVSDGLVEDAVQDVFVVVHRRLPEFDGRFSIRTWLFAIAFRVASDYRRKSRRSAGHEAVYDGDDSFRDGGPSPADRAERGQALRLAEELLGELDDNKRAVLLLSEIEGMTAPEVAAVMGAPLNTVYTWLRRARAQLSEAVARRHKRMK
jgi:RNA polymerase sigma-70 factor (ECF subfamily)